MTNQVLEMIAQASRAGQNLCYRLRGNEAYSNSRHKMMEGSLNKVLLPCVCYSYNGNPKLMYLVEEKKSLASLNGKLNEKKTIALVANLLDAAEQLSRTGFLNLDNVDRSEHALFVDLNTMKCYFVYLPLANGGDGAGRERFEAEIIAILRNVVVRCSGGGSQLGSLAMGLSSRDADLSQLCRYVKNLTGAADISGSGNSVGASGGQDLNNITGHRGLHFVSVNAPETVDFHLNKPEFILGSSVNGVDGTISFNKAISRVHCKITQKGMRIFVTDMGSSNGTYINHKRIMEGVAAEIQIGDEVRLANSTFTLRGE